MARLFSIIVPVYGVEKYLRKCIESLIHQSYHNIEIILIDDGSKDNSPQICDEYADKDARIRVIHKENGGRVRARQVGAEIATGDYIICVDSDDYVSSDYVQVFAEAIEKNLADIVCCGYIEVDEGGEKEHKISVKKGVYEREDMEKVIFPKLLFDKYGETFSPTLWSKAIKREIYIENQLVDCKVEIGEDTAILKPCIFRAQKIEIIDKCTYYYVRHIESITRRGEVLSWNGPVLIAKNIREKIDLSLYDLEQQYCRMVVRQLFSVAISQLHRKEGYLKTKKNIRKHLTEPIYSEALKKCSFSYLDFRDQIIRLSLKYRLVWLMYLYKVIKIRK